MRYFAWLAVFVCACSASPGRSCSSDGDCPSGQSCLDGYCTSRDDGGSSDGGRDAGRIPRDAQAADVVCVAVENAGGLVRRPIDAIVLPDESGTMGAARDAVAQVMDTTFKTTMEANEIDYHVIWHGVWPLPNLEASGRLTRNPVMLGSGADYMFRPALDTYSTWRPALREDAIKVFVHFTDATSTQGDVINGYTGMFDEVLVNLEPAVWGTAGDYRFVYHTFVGLTVNSPPEAPYTPSDPIITDTCDSAFVTPVPLQEMAIRTGGLRFPLCRPDLFDSVFRVIADSAIARAVVPCEVDLPPPQAGMMIDLNTLAVRYRSGASEQVLLRAESTAECSATGFTLVGGTRVVLCPEACAIVEADPDAVLNVLSGCSPELY